jgi:hypothetical protein
MKRRKRSDDIPKPGSSRCLGMSLAGACFVGQMGVRRRGGASSVSGSGVELGNRSLRWGWSWVDMVSVRENSKQLNLQGGEYRCGAAGRTTP